MAGTPNSWTFEFAGMEHESAEPANLYFLPGSNAYNPKLQIDLYQVGPQGAWRTRAGAVGGGAGRSAGRVLGRRRGGGQLLARAEADAGVHFG